LKDALGIEKVQLDKDPLKDKIKQAMLCRRRRNLQEAVDILLEALKEAQELKNDLAVTRVYVELAELYLQMNNLDEADRLYRDIVHRLIQLHGKTETSPEFITQSLKLAEIYARRGELEKAEIGYKHCVSKQMLNMENHMKNYLIAKGANYQDRHPVENYRDKYTDPIALFAWALEDYAHFLLNYFGTERQKEVEEFMDEVLKLSYHIYGVHHFHSINIINNFGAKCNMRRRFDLAKKHLAVGIDRVVNIQECEPILVAYYTNYSEALFHCNQIDEAMTYAIRARELAKSSDDPKIKDYAEKFYKDIEKDARKLGYKPPSDGTSFWSKWIPSL